MLKENEIKEIEKKLGYEFKNKELLQTALTHSSYANLNNLKSNERLEFLGDSVLHFATTNYLYKNLELEEGKLSKLRSYVVSTISLSEAIDKLELINFIQFGKHSKKSYPSGVKADLFEAILGAIYLDSNYFTASQFIYEKLNYSLNYFKVLLNDTFDYKTNLQEVIQKNNKNILEYKITNKKGEQHNPIFTAQVFLNNKLIGKGKGSTKKEAENNSAKSALKSLK